MPAKKPKIVLIVQSRVGSVRLPGKSMMDIVGQPLIVRILERLSRSENADEIVLAIPDTKENDLLETVGSQAGVRVFRGSESNLMSRFKGAAEVSSADVIVRFPGDNAVPEPSEIDRIIDFHLAQPCAGFSTNICDVWGSGYPDGIGAEVFEKTLLDDALSMQPSELMLEHVHLNFFDYVSQKARKHDWCPVRTIPCPDEFKRPDIVLDINTIDEYNYILSLYQAVYPLNKNFSILDVIDWHDNLYTNKKTEAE